MRMRENPGTSYAEVARSRDSEELSIKKNTLGRQKLHYKYNIPLLPTKKNSNSFADVERCKDSQLLRQWTFCLYIYCIYRYSIYVAVVFNTH